MVGKKQFLVLGLGRFGTSVAKTLFEKGYEVMVVDNDIEKINGALEYTTHAYKADITDEDALRALGAESFDVAVVAAGSSFESMVLATLILKEMGVNYVLAKAKTTMQKNVLTKVGADRVVFPEKEMGRRIAMSLIHENLFEFMELSNNVSIAEFTVLPGWIGKTLMQCQIRSKYGINIIAIKTKDHIDVDLESDRIFSSDEIIVAIGTDKNIEKLARKQKG